MAEGATGDRLTQAVAIEKKARQFEHEGRLGEAFAEYKNAANVFQFVYRWENNPRVKEMVRERLEEVVKRAEAVKQSMEAPPPPAPPAAAAPGAAASAARPPQQGPAPGQAPGAQDGKEDEDPEAAKLKKGLEGAILTSKPNVKWDDVAGLVQAKGMLQETVILPVRFPQLFQGKRQPWKGILLYGPPGTGKSYLAMACATEADSTFFSISSSDLVSKWQGESEKLVRSLFEMAREQKPAIIFIDEVDSLCGARGEGEAESSRRIKTEFLVQMEGVGKAQGDLLVLGATNCPWDLDAAIRRRFERRIYIPLPELEARQLCLKINLGSTVHSLTDQDFARIASLTEGLSAADMKILVRDAIFEPVRRLQRAVCFKQTPRPEDGKLMWTPCSPGADGAVEKTLMQISGDELQEPQVCMADFEGSATRVKPSVAEGDLKQYQDWTEQYGMEG